MVLKSGERRIIGNVIKFCEEEKLSGRLKTKLRQARRRAAEMTGVSESVVAKIKREINGCDYTSKKVSTLGKKKRTTKDKNVFDDFDLCAIRNIVLSFYSVKKEAPTLKNVKVEIKKIMNNDLNRDDIRNIIMSIGFKLKKIENKKTLLIEKTPIAALRQKYLRRILDIKSKNPHQTIVYLDEIWIQPYYNDSNCWEVEKSCVGVFKNQLFGECFVIVHAGTGNGFVNGACLIVECSSKTGDYIGELNYITFSKWVKEKLLPNIPQNCLIVMDNAPYHSVVINKAPSASSKKTDIKSWLINNHIDFDDNLLKSELLQIVKKNKGEIVYKIDEIFRKAGHEVCRLPPYHCDLNPIELVWNIVRHKVAEINISPGICKFRDLIEDAVQRVTIDDWTRCCNEVYMIESKYIQQDRIIDNEFDSIIANVNGDSDSDSDCSDADESDMSQNEEPLSEDGSMSEMDELLSDESSDEDVEMPNDEGKIIQITTVKLEQNDNSPILTKLLSSEAAETGPAVDKVKIEPKGDDIDNYCEVNMVDIKTENDNEDRF